METKKEAVNDKTVQMLVLRWSTREQYLLDKLVIYALLANIDETILAAESLGREDVNHKNDGKFSKTLTI